MAKGEELQHWINVDASPKELGVLHGEVQDLVSIFDTYRKELDKGTLEGEKQEIIPRTESRVYKGDTSFIASAYFYRAKNSSDPNRTIYCYVDEDTSQEGRHRRLSINPIDGVISDLDNSHLDFDDQQLFKTLLYSSKHSLEMKMGEREQRTKKMKRGIFGSVGALACVAMLGGIGYGIVRDGERKQAEKRQAIEQFDQSKFEVPGVPFETTHSKVGLIPETQYKKIPMLEEDAELVGVRRIQVGEKDCEDVSLPRKAKGEVYLGVRDNDPYRSTPVGATRVGDELYVCSFEEYDESIKGNEIDLAVQVR